MSTTASPTPITEASISERENREIEAANATLSRGEGG